MRYDVLTIFPEYFQGPFDYGIIRRAREASLIDVRVHDLRSFTYDKHHIVDDRPFGGGDGMVMKPEPIFHAVETLTVQSTLVDEANQVGDDTGKTAIVLLSPQGKLFKQNDAEEFARDYTRMILICGRYEGIDERVAENLITHELSIGDYVLSGGEIPAMIVVDAVTRLIPGALGSPTSALNDSFSSETLDYPHYTRPADFRGMKVPDVLLGGNHADIDRWRKNAAMQKTLKMRPDLIKNSNSDEAIN